MGEQPCQHFYPKHFNILVLLTLFLTLPFMPSLSPPINHAVNHALFVPRPTLAAADGLHHRYARNGSGPSGKQPNKSRSGHLQKKNRTIKMQNTRA